MHGDCLELMKNIPDKSIDAIICDLPYGTTACSWDTILPFDDLWAQYNRVVSDNGCIVLFGSQPFTTHLIMSNIRNFREEIIWLKNKSGSGMQCNQKHIKVHEAIIVFSNSGTYTYNPQKWDVSDDKFLTHRKTMSEYGDTNTIYGNMKRNRKPDDGTRFPISVISYKVPITAANSKTYSANIDVRVHQTQKPLELLEYLVRTYTNENETVLDNCMGSGSTGVACKILNRNFIGIEKDDEYFKIAKDRIENYKLTKKLF